MKEMDKATYVYNVVQSLKAIQKDGTFAEMPLEYFEKWGFVIYDEALGRHILTDTGLDLVNGVDAAIAEDDLLSGEQ